MSKIKKRRGWWWVLRGSCAGKQNLSTPGHLFSFGVEGNNAIRVRLLLAFSPLLMHTK